jgi:hypothetical protein
LQKILSHTITPWSTSLRGLLFIILYSFLMYFLTPYLRFNLPLREGRAGNAWEPSQPKCIFPLAKCNILTNLSHPPHSLLSLVHSVVLERLKGVELMDCGCQSVPEWHLDWRTILQVRIALSLSPSLLFARGKACLAFITSAPYELVYIPSTPKSARARPYDQWTEWTVGLWTQNSDYRVCFKFFTG